MLDPNVVLAGCGLALAVVVGLLAHEWSHALVLRMVGIEHTVTYLPGREDGVVGLLRSCPWAVVTPHPTGRERAIYLRTAALAPSLLAVPVFTLGMSGVPIESPVLTAVAVGWLACSIPSPQDFSVAFYAHRSLESDSLADANATNCASRAD